MKFAERKKKSTQRIRMHEASEKLMRFKNNQIRLCSVGLFFFIRSVTNGPGEGLYLVHISVELTNLF